MYRVCLDQNVVIAIKHAIQHGNRGLPCNILALSAWTMVADYEQAIYFERIYLNEKYLDHDKKISTEWWSMWS